ncbi:acyltransferase [Paraconexibacter algicola]|uniref:Acyltransferase n=1 Tax=Paraconexibacter algicola TaxID=2133960 RepID=A0A2T4UC82_9ACTN|nr:acyltransferase [Paraconexibacter algicola]PTL54817.1 acyltransferase [Paraconexibacter algicola]
MRRILQMVTLRHVAGLLRWAGWWVRNPRQRWPLFWIDHGALIQIGPHGRLEIGRGVVIHPDVTLHVHGHLRLADNVILGRGVYLDASERIEVGEASGLAEWASVHDGQHRAGLDDTPFLQRPWDSAPVVIGRNVWVGAKATIQAGVTIGDHSVVGSNAVVTRDVPAATIVAGVPAKPIGEVTAETQLGRATRARGDGHGASAR